MIESSAWKSFDEIEESLTVDELMLLLKVINSRTKEQFRLMAAVQGIEVEPEQDEIADKGDDDLPEELKEMERKRQERLKQELPQGAPDPAEEMKDFLLGYSRIVAENID